jgi:hypothetical protein
MRSRAEPRHAAEWGLRVALLALLALSLWRALRERPGGAEVREVASDVLPGALDDATRDARVGALDLRIDSVPTAAQRAWLVALRGAGVGVRWSGAIPAMGLQAERVREPDAPVRILLAADTGAAIVLADSAGVLDTVRAARGAATLDAAEVVGPVRARRGAHTALVAAPPSDARREVLVLGRASWESRFVLAALGEAGWRSRARLPAAPGVSVSDAGVLPIDTARYDVVVALDSSAADLAPAIARFVGAGGGLVAAGSATELEALRTLLPARAGERRPGRILFDADSVTRADLPMRPLGLLRPDAVMLERQPAGIAVAVRRAGFGRALAVGYDESWRWRMLGGSSGPAAHRDWWSRTIGLVAPEREGPRAASTGPDGAPMAALVSALGPASPAEARAAGTDGDALPLVLLVLFSLALLAETASRRFRGAR